MLHSEGGYHAEHTGKGKEHTLDVRKQPDFPYKGGLFENFSIQGYIRWIEEEKTVPFRSYMELLHLIEEGLHISKSEMTRLRS